MKVFISSTYEDLKDYRQAAIKVVNRCKETPLAMEFFTSQPMEPTAACEKEINDCDVFVGIYAHRYGFIPDGKTKSITHLEYEQAKKLSKPCLCFVVKQDFPWNPQFYERKKYDELATFLGQVKKENVVSFFESASDFESKLAVSLAAIIRKENQRPAGGGIHIPMAPAPFIPHPYPLPGHFTGRDDEIAMLSNWFAHENQPVLVLEAIGGMGKSALTWVWLQHHILEPGVKIDGVFWWSFYEAPFELFLQELDNYVLGKRKPNPGAGSLLSADLTELQAALHHGRFLLVLDGLERALRGYSGMEAMYLREKPAAALPCPESPWEKQQREPVHPLGSRFLRHLASGGNSRVLISSRLMPVPLEDLAGVKHVCLQGLAPKDAARFLRQEGVKGTEAELEQAGRVYEFHPLMLKLLASAIKRSRGKDVQGAYRLNLISKDEPHKILTTSFQLLSREEQEVVSRLSVFRGVFTFASAAALFPGKDADRLWEVLAELRGLGFLFYEENEKQDRFDFHPLLRSFLYHGLTKPGEVHTLAAGYFQPLSEEVKKIVSLEDLGPVIELYHHLVKAGKYDEAVVLFRDRITQPTYFQLSAYRLSIELLLELFPDGEDRFPRLEQEAAQAWTLNELANTYSLSGQPARSVPLFLLQNKLREKNADKRNLAIGLGNVANVAQIQICQLSAAAAHLRKNIALCREIEDEFNEAVGHRELGRVLVYQGRAAVKVKGDGPRAQEELAISTAYWEKEKHYQGLSVDSAYRSLAALVQARLAGLDPGDAGEETQGPGLCREAVARAREALAFAEKTNNDHRFVTPFRDFVRAYWLLGEAALQSLLSLGAVPGPAFEIPFYDEHFQETREMVSLEKGSEGRAVERCLNEALGRCRKVNLVELEPDILLARARLLLANASPPAEIEPTLAEAFEIARRAGYRLNLADLHLFCGQVLIQSRDLQTLRGLKAHEHLEKTKEYALDVSEFSHLYESADPGFYKDIPEYDMLKHGLTKKERIKNGYYPAYRMAELLL